MFHGLRNNPVYSMYVQGSTVEIQLTWTWKMLNVAWSCCFWIKGKANILRSLKLRRLSGSLNINHLLVFVKKQVLPKRRCQFTEIHWSHPRRQQSQYQQSPDFLKKRFFRNVGAHLPKYTNPILEDGLNINHFLVFVKKQVPPKRRCPFTEVRRYHPRR